MSALQNFQLKIESIALTAVFINDALVVQKHTPALLGEVNKSFYAVKFFEKLRQGIGKDYQAASNSLLVTAWGCVENYVREVLPELAMQINKSNIISKKFPKQLVNNNVRLTSEALRDSIGDSALRTYDLKRMSADFAELFRKDGPMRLNDQAMGMIGGKFTLCDLESYFNRLLFEINWGEVGGCQKLQDFFDISSKESAGQKCKELLIEVIKDRNKIAHQGEGVTLRTNEPVERLLEFLKLIVERFDLLLKNHIDSLCSNAKT